MATYKTPDVYVEEISVFPPSVAEVETAIPAFIGYTEKATKVTDGDLEMVPTRIKSMLEFEQYYGYAAAPVINGVYIDDSGNFKSADITTTYFTYDSIRLFYDNGGGDCYIVSVGSYKDDIDETALKNGLAVVANYDEPTILLFPDAVTLDASELGNLQKQALKQCNDLMDRVSVFDVQLGDENGTSFRDNIGMNYLKYGMAYTPWLKVALNKNVSYNDFKTKVFRANTTTPALSLKLFTTNADIKAVIDNYDLLVADQVTIAGDVTGLLGADTTYRQKFSALVNAYESDKSEAKLEAIFKFLYDTAKKVDKWANTLTNSSLSGGAEGYINTDLRDAFTTVIGYELAIADEVTFATVNGGYTDATISNAKWDDGTDNIFTASYLDPDAATVTALGLLGTDEEKMDYTLGKVKVVFEDINEAWLDIAETVSNTEANYEANLVDSFPLYKNLLKGINDSATVMPPSGAMAGIFAATDRDRGVWKAPANVSVASVLGPNFTFAASELDKLNIDANAGKSINAIRAFAGKGTLVWGARTLAGNDNEWRYIPVRRFYVNVEESIKKSTYWAVFEPNNANTWIRVKGMIESYLTNKWKEGALVGAKPDEAFFVRIGVGQTMTPDDVLNGYMKVEIGMAVVRPAEFIVLKFSHKLQQA
jgi:phage tail sheath protein FI